MRNVLALLLVASLAACGSPPTRPGAARAPNEVLRGGGGYASFDPPLSYPPSVRERVLRIARAEWAEWGGYVADPGTPDDDTHIESQTANFPRVLAYWRAVPNDEGAADRNRELYRRTYGADGTSVWRQPAWSAAFLSYVMRSAGVDAREFPPSASHGTYVDVLTADATNFPDVAPFVPHDVGEYAPAIGDLICADRSRRPITSWRDRLADGGAFRPMHCDLVAAVSPGLVEAIGGNVRDAVTLTRYLADGTGRLLPRAPDQATVFTVFENRLGRLPPFTTVPVAARATGFGAS